MSDNDRDEDDLQPSEMGREGEGLYLRLQAWFKADLDHWSDWREDAKEDYDFAAGEQWSAEDKETLRAQMRPIVTFNRLGVIIDTISGSEVNNRQEIRYLPREMGDVKVNEVYTAAGDWFRDSCHAEDEESDAFLDAVICGMGWTETRLDYADNPDGDPLIERIDPLEMVVDSAARRSNLIDARRMFRIKDMRRSEAKELFPDIEPELLDAPWARYEDAEDKRTDRAGYGSNEVKRNAQDDDIVTLVHAQWIELKDAWRIMDPMSGEPMVDPQTKRSWFDKEPIEIISMIPEEMREQIVVRFRRKVVMQAWLGDEILDGPMPTLCEKFSWNCITGKRDRNKGVWYGIVRQMKDPQRWANKWMSQTLHIMNSNAKGGVMAEADAFADPLQAEKTFARPEAITWTNPGALQNGKIQPKPVAPFPVGQFQMMEFAISSVRDVSGVNLEMLGGREANQPGVLEYQRKQSAMTVLARMFDSLRRYRKRQGELMLGIIDEYLSDGRLIRIVGDQGSKFVPLMREQGVREFDVIVDESSSSPNQKEQAWGVMQQMLPVVGQMLTPELWVEIAAYSPLPSSFVDKLREHIQNAEPQPDPEQQKAQAQIMLEQQKAQMTFQLKQQEAGLKADIEIGKAQQDAMSEQQRRDMEMAHAERQFALDSQKALLDLHLKQQLAAIELQKAQIKGAADIQLQERKAENDARKQEFDFAAHAQRTAHDLEASKAKAEMAKRQKSERKSSSD